MPFYTKSDATSEIYNSEIQNISLENQHIIHNTKFNVMRPKVIFLTYITYNL